MHGGWHSLKQEVFIYFPSQEQSIFDLSFIKGIKVVTPRSRSNTHIYTLQLESSIDLMLLVTFVCLYMYTLQLESSIDLMLLVTFVCLYIYTLQLESSIELMLLVTFVCLYICTDFIVCLGDLRIRY